MLLWPIRLVIRIVSLLITAAIVYVVVCGVQVVTASKVPSGTSGLKPAAAIVVVGGGLRDGSLDSTLTAQLEAAVSAFRAHLAPSVILGTDAPGGTDPIGTAAQGWLTKNGVPSSAIELDGASNAASAIAGAAAILGHGAGAILVVPAVETMWTRTVADHDGLVAQIEPGVGSEVAFYKEIGLLWNQASSIAAGRVVGDQRVFWSAG